MLYVIRYEIFCINGCLGLNEKCKNECRHIAELQMQFTYLFSFIGSYNFRFNLLSTFLWTIDWLGQFVSCANASEVSVVFNIFINSVITRFVPHKVITSNHRTKSKKHKQRYPSLTKKLQNRKLRCWHAYKSKHNATTKEIYNKADCDLKIAIFRSSSTHWRKIISSRNDGAFYNHVNISYVARTVSVRWEELMVLLLPQPKKKPPNFKCTFWQCLD